MTLNADEAKALAQGARDDLGLFFHLIMGDVFTMFPFTENLVHLGQTWETTGKYGLAIAAPPRSGKTEIASVLLTAWLLGRRPNENTALVSYSEDRSIDNTLKVRDIVTSKMYQQIFPEVKLKKSQSSKKNFATTKGGTVYALGRNSPVSGRTFHAIVIDDFIKEPDEIYSESMREAILRSMDNLRTRITNRTRLVVIGTRWFEDDPVGVFFNEALENPDQWVVASFPAIAEETEYFLSMPSEKFRDIGDALIPDLTSKEKYAQIEKTMDPHLYAALYQQNPIGEESHFRREWLQYTDPEDLKTMSLRNFLTVDPAMSTKEHADNTGFCLVQIDQTGKWHVQSWGEKLAPRDLIEKIFFLNDHFKFEKIGIEKTAFTQGIQPFMQDEMRKRNAFLPIEELSHGNKAKEARILGALPAMYSSGTVYHVKGECTMLEKEMFAFPKGKHDDVLDAAGYAAIMLTGQRSSGSGKMSYAVDWKGGRLNPGAAKPFNPNASKEQAYVVNYS